MNELMRDLPLNIRQIANQIKDAEVNSVPDVVRAAEELRKAQEEVEGHATETRAFHDMIKDVNAQIDSFKLKAEEIDAARPALAADIVAGVRADADDAMAQTKRMDLIRQREVCELALSSLEDTWKTGQSSREHRNNIVLNLQLKQMAASRRVSGGR